MKNILILLIVLFIFTGCSVIPLKVEWDNKKEIQKYSGYNGKQVLDIFSTKEQIIILFTDGTNLEIKKSDL